MSRTPRCWETCSTASAMPTPASPEPRRYRGALIGAGGIARQSHLPALRGAPALQRRLEVVALVDSAADVPPVDTLPLLARREQLADLGPLDFIDICRPTADPGRAAGDPGLPWRGTRAAGRGGVLLDHGTHLIYQLLDIAGLPSTVSAWTGRLRHAAYEVEDTASLRFEYPGGGRLVTMFFTWAARSRENRIRFVGDAGAIEWAGGELRLERAGVVERFDYSAELEKSAYHRWFTGLFERFVAALDHGAAAAAAPFLEDIRRVASVVEHAYTAARSGTTVAIPGSA